MCGIAAYLGSEQAYPLLTAALSKLEYRGYDSAGIALIDGNGDIHLNKTINKVASLSENNSEALLKSTVGIAHTRWATHGSPTVSNAHPHIDRDKNIAVVHNGIIENFAELKAQLQKQGYEVLGVSTDGEKSHQKFISKHELPFKLIADEDKSVHEAYGTWDLKKFMGREYMGTVRTTFVIDEEGKIEEVIEKVKTKDHTAQILK